MRHEPRSTFHIMDHTLDPLMIYCPHPKNPETEPRLIHSNCVPNAPGGLILLLSSSDCYTHAFDSLLKEAKSDRKCNKPIPTYLGICGTFIRCKLQRISNCGLKVSFHKIVIYCQVDDTNRSRV